MQHSLVEKLLAIYNKQHTVANSNILEFYVKVVKKKLKKKKRKKEENWAMMSMFILPLTSKRSFNPFFKVSFPKEIHVYPKTSSSLQKFIFHFLFKKKKLKIQNQKVLFSKYANQETHV